MKLIREFLTLSSIVMFGVAQMPAQQEHTAPVAASESIPNLGPLLARVNALKTELRQYYACSCTCGCYAKDLDLEANRAIEFLRVRAACRSGDQRPAMVLDIDETTLSNWTEMEAANFEYDGKGFERSSLVTTMPHAMVCFGCLGTCSGESCGWRRLSGYSQG